MSAAPVTPPAHPLYALTTYELRGYRRDLEHALDTLPGAAEGRRLLQQRLANVLAEQDPRARITAGGRHE